MELLTTPPCDPFCEGEHPVIVIEMFNGRKIRIQLEPACAPITVAYFLTLVKEGFYNGLKFHRVVHGFMIQGGDPTGTGDGETDFYVKGEFAANGVSNPLSHMRGTLSMARQEGYDSASCQFFIMLNDTPSLNGTYAPFGRVIEGMEEVDYIGSVNLMQVDKPAKPMVMRRVYLEETA